MKGNYKDIILRFSLAEMAWKQEVGVRKHSGKFEYEKLFSVSLMEMIVANNNDVTQ